MLQPVNMTICKVDIIIFYTTFFLICLFLVFDTDNTELLKMCGSRLPDAIISKGNMMTVKFETDHNIGKKVKKTKRLLDINQVMSILIFRDLKLHGKRLEVMMLVWREWLDLQTFQITIQKPRLRCKHIVLYLT